MGEVGWFPLFSLKIIHSNITIIKASNYHMRMLRVDVNTHYSDIGLAYKLRIGWILNKNQGRTDSKCKLRVGRIQNINSG